MMFRSAALKTSAILLSLAMLITAYPALAEDATNPAVRKPVLAPAAPLTQQRIEGKRIDEGNLISTLQGEQASKAAALRVKLQAFRNKVKATVAERVSTNLNMINQRQTTNMKNNLSTISLILDKLEARVNRNTPDIKDPADAKTTIASARQAIATAAAAIAAQTQKDYTIQVTSENGIKADAKAARDRLYKDLLSLRKSVIDAKQAVVYAIRVAKAEKLPVTTNIKEGTASGQQ